MRLYLWNAFSAYADSCTIHGIKFLAEPKRPIWERICWIFAFIGVIFGCTKFILTVLEKWDDSPVILSFNKQAIPIWQIPFPAITICPQSKSRLKIFNYTKIYKTDFTKLRDLEFERLAIIAQTCKSETNLRNNIFNISGYDEKFMSRDCIERIQEVSLDFNKTISNCITEDTGIECDQLFSLILTDEGLCYTFNILKSEELFRKNEIRKDYVYYKHKKNSTQWTLENGYSKHLPFEMKTYPKRVATTTIEDTLYLKLKTNESNFDFFCSGSLQGFKILFHSPSEYPLFSRNSHFVMFNTEVNFAIEPKIITTSKALRNYSPKRRQCYFNSDRQLRYFQIYTQHNCELECITNYTLSKCGCVKFYMPSSKDTRICGPNSMECCKDAEYEIATNQQKKITTKKYGELPECNCLPACTSIEYDSHTSEYDIDWKVVLKAHKIKNDEKIKTSHIKILFNDVKFLATKRFERYGYTDLIANIGGLLGLFMGISLLSVVEIFYFFSIRLCSNKIMKDRQGSADIQHDPASIPLKDVSTFKPINE